MKRRDFLGASGALVLAFCWQWSAAQPKEGADLPGSLKKQPLLDGWIRIAADGSITVFTGKAELGQGIKTALLQVAAEELAVAPQRIQLVTADTELTPNEGYTAGSHSMQDSGSAIRHAAAQVRAKLADLAAARLSAPVETLQFENGAIRAGRQSLSYAQLVDGLDLHVEATPQEFARAPKTHTVVGRSLPRVDIPAKLSGGAAYVQDMRLDGMLHGRIVRPPSAAAALKQLDVARAERLPGVVKVVRDGRFIGVIAQREFQAVSAMRVLAQAAVWEVPPALPPQTQLYQAMPQWDVQDFVIADQRDPARSGSARLSATYRRPYLMHASIGPSCAIAQLVDGKYTVWSHTQGVYPLRGALSEMLGVQEQDVHCIHVEGSGCYGHNGADDVAADAALLARAMPGRPVRVQWMREDEHGREPLGPPMIANVSAALDEQGMIADWQYEVWSNTHSTRPGSAGDLLAATHLAQPFAPPPPKPLPLPEGGGDRNAIPLYSLPNLRVTHHFLRTMPLRVSALRSLGAYHNVFAIECFIDELARAARSDPLAFRQKHMLDPRARDAMQAAAAHFGWNDYRRQPARGRGFAFARYKNLAAYCAIACEVEVRRDTGEIRVLRAIAAVDSGEAVNPDGIRNQIEGAIVQALSWTTMEEVRFDARQLRSLDWGGYPILRFPQVPDQIEVHIIDRPGMPFLGTGEAAQGPAAAAVANAVADASGVRIRDLPLSRARLRGAIGV